MPAVADESLPSLATSLFDRSIESTAPRPTEAACGQVVGAHDPLGTAVVMLSAIDPPVISVLPVIAGGVFSM